MMLHLFGVWERKKFAVRRGENAWQTRSLLCVFFRAHGKVFFKKMMLHLVGVWGEKKICRASWRKRTSNMIFAVRFLWAHDK
jgi:hypothetical protein